MTDLKNGWLVSDIFMSKIENALKQHLNYDELFTFYCSKLVTDVTKLFTLILVL